MIKTLKETVCKSNSSQLGCYPAVVILQDGAHACFTGLAQHLYPYIHDLMADKLEARVPYCPHVEAQSPRLPKPGWSLPGCNSSILPVGGASAAINETQP